MSILAETVINIAKNEIGYLEKKSNYNLYDKLANAGKNNFTKYWQDMAASSNGQSWCNCFVNWCFVQAYGEEIAKSLLCSTSGWAYYTPTSAGFFQSSNQWYTSNPIIGDIIYFKNSSRIHHVGIVYDVDNTNVYTIEGNTSVGTAVVANGGGVAQKQYLLTNTNIAGYGRPNYDSTNSSSTIDFNTTVAKLSSSDNYTYIQQEEESDNKSDTNKSLAQKIKESLNKSKNNNSNIDSTASDIEQVVINYNNSTKINNKYPKASTFSGNISGSVLPIYTTYVEAPFVEVNINGTILGTANSKSGYPNYIQSLTVDKVNATLNTYTLTLVHQILPGNNPNFIAELLSSVGYDTITISYGDGASGQYYKDEKAFITSVKTSFNIGGYNITYTVSATSLSYVLSTNKSNYSEITTKPSSEIMNLLSNSTISNYFVLGNIATTDKEVDISATKNQSPLDRLSFLVSQMKSNVNEDTTSYYLVYSSIQGSNKVEVSVKEVNTDKLSYSSLVYEVDLGYPDKNMVLGFNISTDYAWSLMYESASSIPTYRYEISDKGNLNKTLTTKVSDSSTMSNSQITMSDSLWKQLTRYPITATLTTKQLMTPLPLLTYVKVNNYYFGNERITSGMYIITGQKDSISSSGCRTELSLTRVSSNSESINIDGRVAT